MSEQMREEFEAAIAKNQLTGGFPPANFERCGLDGRYVLPELEGAWWGWQASREPPPSSFTAIDMTTAAADGFRDGAASRAVEIEALRKDLVDWQAVVAAVKREIPERFTSHARGNAPGHGHSISGVWDDDNGALAGKECAWCKAWNAAMSKEG